jgi:hypothetical protein
MSRDGKDRVVCGLWRSICNGSRIAGRACNRELRHGSLLAPGGTNMAILTRPSFGPATSLIYITSGAMLDVWTLVWYWAYGRNEVLSNTAWFWLVGLFLTGVILMGIGVLLGRIGQSARKAELPPTDVVNAEAQILNTAAATPHPVVGPTGGAAGVPVAVAAPAPPAVQSAAAPAARVPAVR